MKCFSHQAVTEQQQHYRNQCCTHLMDASPVSTLLVALFLVSTSSQDKYLALYLLNAALCELAANFVCLPRGARCVAYQVFRF